MSETDWVVVDFNTGRWKCNRCGESIASPELPMNVESYVGMMKAWAKPHRKCKEGDRRV
jgi:hypothetical protein